MGLTLVSSAWANSPARSAGVAVIALGHLWQRRQLTLVLEVGFLVEKMRRKRRNRTFRMLAGAHHRDAPDIDRRHDARRGQPRHDAGKGQRGFSRAACADDEQEWRPPVTGVLQRIDRLGDVARAAEEHRRMLGAERRQPAERRALDVDRPQHRAALEHLLLEPAAQQLLDLDLEGVGALEIVEGELELAVGRLEPGLEEGLEPLPLLGDHSVGRLVVELDGRRLGEAEHIDVGEGFLLARLDRRQNLVGGA